MKIKGAQIEHVVPKVFVLFDVGKGGKAEPGTRYKSRLHKIDNLQAAHTYCNQRKGNTPEVEFLQRIGPDLDLPTSPELAVPETTQEAETAAGEARRMLGYNEGRPAIGLAERAADLGLLVFSLALDDDAADGASILLSRGGVALVNGSRALGRRRLTLAHELGHFLFADEFSTDWSVADDPPSASEARIDRFARALLLPESALRSAWQGDQDTRTRAVLIASEYRVDMSTLSRRLSELGVASPAEATVVRSTRTRRADIVEHALLVPQDLAPPEFPGAYIRAVLNAYRSEEISAARAIGMLPETWAEDDLPDLPKWAEENGLAAG